MPSTRASCAAAVVAAATVVVLSLFAYGLRLVEPRVRELEGRIERLDVATRQATLEFRHPRTGAVIRAAGTVEPDCRIEIDGRGATLDELQPGDHVRVAVELHPMIGRRAVVRQAIRLESRSAAESSP